MSLMEVNVPLALRPIWKPARYKAVYGGRASLKSHGFSTMAAIKASQHSGLRVLCIREVQKSLDQSVKFLVERKIEHYQLPSFRSLNTHIETPGGGRISFHGMQNHTADSIKSLEDYDIAYVEEAQSLSQRSLDLLRPTIRKPGSELWFGWNPDLPTDPVDALFRSGSPPTNSIILRVNYRDNPHLPQVLKDEIAYDLARNPTKAAHVWDGEYRTQSEALVFSNWSIEEFETPADAAFLLGADWGFSVDPTVLVRAFIVGRKLFIDAEAYKVGCRIDDTPALFDTVAGSRDWPIRADSARPETIDYMKRNGFPKIVPATKGPNSVKDGIEFIQSYDVVIHPRCRHVVDEFGHYSWKTNPHTGDIMPILEDKDNHVIDAVRYALEQVRNRKVLRIT